MKSREELIEEVAEFILSEKGAFYYNHDLLAVFPIGETELQIAFEVAQDMRRKRRGS